MTLAVASLSTTATSTTAAPTIAPPTTAAPTTAAPSTAAPSPTVTVVTTQTPAPATAATTAPESASFPFSSSAIEGDVRARIVGVSWRAGCPVPLGDLRYLRVGYWDDGGNAQVGELVVHADVVSDVRSAFAAMYTARFPLTSLRLVDDFGGDDDASMAVDNTSAFNCRPVAGTSRWSQHAFGRAIDINPLRNPYVEADRVSPVQGTPYADRADVRPGMIIEAGPVVAAFDALGWGWGGRWAGGADYQHFSAAGN